jgi:starch-binding outer membrane protein, SusD/RagB family
MNLTIKHSEHILRSLLLKVNKRFSVPLYNILVIAAIAFTGSACEQFYEPDLEVGLRTDEFFNDETEFRAAAMGMYALQQDLVDQLVILGELRGDLMEITENADNDLREIHNFNVSPGNRYASPRNFYRLIAATNRLMLKIAEKHPHVLDNEAPVNNYDRYYGEALCMRSWAYFNAARIYGTIPYIPSSITTIDEIEEFVNSPKQVRDTFKIRYHPNGYSNDTIRYDTTYVIDNAFIGLDDIIDTLTNQLKNKVKAVGVNHHIVNADVTWDATIWTNYSMQVLLGQMYLTKGDLVRALESFQPILFNFDQGFGIVRFGLDNTFRNSSWRNILTSINLNEHIYVLKFNKADKQRHNLQYMSSSIAPNSYQIKPTRKVVDYWEAIWDDWRLIPDIHNPGMMILDPERPGTPGDFFRGINVSYGYFRGAHQLSDTTIASMLEYKRVESMIDVNNLMDGADTVIMKYSLNKNPFDWDADFILYRAAGIHLYAAEIYANYGVPGGAGGAPPLNMVRAERYLNDGSYQNLSVQLGVRGRVGFADGPEYVTTAVDRIPSRDPYTNRVIGSVSIASLSAKQLYLEEKILEERARELAFEGERFYDLMRIAKRRNDPAFLADKVAGKFRGPEANMIRSHLMAEDNWYIPFYIGNEAP